MMIEVRFHGRGSQGAKIASRILGQSGFLSGLEAQDFALFGAERRGAPVISFTRLSSEPIDRRGNIERPNLVIVMDDSLLTEATAQFFHGVDANTPVIVNADRQRYLLNTKELPLANYVFIDFGEIARQLTGHSFVSVPAAAAAARCVPAIGPTELADAVRGEIAEFGLEPDLNREKYRGGGRSLRPRASFGDRHCVPG